LQAGKASAVSAAMLEHLDATQQAIAAALANEGRERIEAKAEKADKAGKAGKARSKPARDPAAAVK
jgi:hypothetical protein